jgi:glutamyl-tRNA reductase
MSILVIGVNHQSGPLEVLERVTLAPTEIAKAVQTLVARDNVREAVVVSTCNRTEIYAVTERFHGAYADIRDFLCESGNIGADDLHPHLFSQHDEDAVQHLFSVAAGLDSAVIGESEILGQLRTAWETAHREGGSRSTLNMLFRHAIEVGKRARTETNIARGTASVSHAAVEMALEHRGDLAGCSVAVLGAGAMGEGIAVALTAAGAADVTVVNRSPERGVSLAERVGGTAVGMDEVTRVLSGADVVLTSTGSGTPIVTTAMMNEVERAGRPLLFVDIAVPRDVAPDVALLDDVTVLDLDDLKTWAARGRAQRLAEVGHVTEIVVAEVERFTLEASARRAAPLVAALRQRGEDLRRAVMARHDSRLAHLSDADRELVESITRGVVAKLLHEPSVRLRDEAGTPQGERNAAAVADLFDLG